MAITFDRDGRSEGSSPSSGFPAPVSPEPRPTGLTYEPFYGLKEKPFSLTSDSRFFYQSPSHAPAFDDLLDAIRRRESLNVLTGDIGTGKTTLCRAVLESLDRKTFTAFVADPFASREELLKVLLADFGVASIDDVTSGRLRGATRTELSYLLYQFLGTLAPLQAFAVVLIDEAQNLSQQLLEEVRILSDADGQLQVVLVGQLDLRARLRLPDMRQLDQRVSVHCQLQPLDLAGVAGYISHRLHVAGGSPDRVRFSGEAVEAIYLRSGGLPRVINRICDRALRHGYSKKAATIDADIVESANPEPDDERLPLVSASPALPTPAAAAPLPIAPAPIAPPPIVAPQSVMPPIVASPIAAPPRRIAPLPVDTQDESLVARPLPDHLEPWLKEIETQPTVDLDWRQRWAATNAVAAPAAERRSGVTLKIPAVQNPHQHTHADRIRRRWPWRFIGIGVAVILLFGTIVRGRAAVAASLDIWSQIAERFRPPPMPVLPPTPPRPAGAPAQIIPPDDPLGALAIASPTAPGR